MKIVNKQCLLILVFCLITLNLSAQDLNFNQDIRRLIENSGKESKESVQQDTIVELNIPVNPQYIETKPDTVVQVVRPTHTRPVRRQPLKMSQEALYWSRHAGYANNKFNSYVRFRDTIIVNPIFMPALFKPGNVMPVKPITFYTPGIIDGFAKIRNPYDSIIMFKDYQLKRSIDNLAYRYIQRNSPNIFKYTAESLPSETTHYISKKDDVKIEIETKEIDPTDYDTPLKFIPDRRYWTSSFESAIKFSENYSSSNWYKGGTQKAIFNIFTKNMFKYNYAKGPIIVKNEFEVNASFYNTINDDSVKFKVSDDLLRFYTNFGYKAISKWFYTADVEFKTQMFTNYKERSRTMQAAFLSPYEVNLGIGMKYDLVKTYKKKKDRSLNLSVNISPLSFKFMHSLITDNIDLNRYGFPVNEVTGKTENRSSKLGSRIRVDMNLRPNRSVTWKSKLDFFTSYDRAIGEFENSFDFAMSRFFSTLIYLNVRFDDSVTKPHEDYKYFQFNQFLSFGFSYKW